jgi:predicted ATPase
MTDPIELREVERRIQVVEDNLRQLQEQATALSGAADEERIANRIADQEAKLAALLKQREAMIGDAQSDAQE